LHPERLYLNFIKANLTTGSSVSANISIGAATFSNGDCNIK